MPQIPYPAVRSKLVVGTSPKSFLRISIANKELMIHASKRFSSHLTDLERTIFNVITKNYFGIKKFVKKILYDLSQAEY